MLKMKRSGLLIVLVLTVATQVNADSVSDKALGHCFLKIEQAGQPAARLVHHNFYIARDQRGGLLYLWVNSTRIEGSSTEAVRSLCTVSRRGRVEKLLTNSGQWGSRRRQITKNNGQLQFFF